MKHRNTANTAKPFKSIFFNSYIGQAVLTECWYRLRQHWDISMSLGQVSTEFSLGFLTPGSEWAEKRKGKRRGEIKESSNIFSREGKLLYSILNCVLF